MIFGRGMYFGDDFLLNSFFRPYVVRSLTYLDCFMLKNSVIEELFRFGQFQLLQVTGIGDLWSLLNAISKICCYMTRKPCLISDDFPCFTVGHSSIRILALAWWLVNCRVRITPPPPTPFHPPPHPALQHPHYHASHTVLGFTCFPPTPTPLFNTLTTTQATLY